MIKEKTFEGFWNSPEMKKLRKEKTLSDFDFLDGIKVMQEVEEMKEKTLSDEIIIVRGDLNAIKVPKVKEFLKKLKESVKPLFNSDWINERIDSLAGDKLT